MTPRKWYCIENAAPAARVIDISIIDFIGGWGDEMFDAEALTAKTFVAQLAKIPDTVKTIRLHVNSPGGDVFSAVNIANALRDQRVSNNRTIEVIIEGLAASAASVVIMAGNTIKISDNALVMIHNPMTFSAGDARDMRTTAEELDKVRGVIVSTYRWQSSLSEKKLSELMDATTWMDADEAIANGFATEKIKGLKAAAAFDAKILDQLGVPDQYRDRLTALTARPAATGTGPRPRLIHQAGASASHRVVNTTQDRNNMAKKSIAERIEGWQNALAAKSAELNGIQDKVEAEGRGKDAAERETFDTLKIEMQSITKEIEDLREMEKLEVSAATPVHKIASVDDASRARGGVVSVKDNLPPGIEFARYAMCMASAKGNSFQALSIAKKRYPDMVRIHRTLNAAVEAGTTTDPEWAGNLVDYQQYAGDFVEFLRPATILGKFGTNGIPSLRRVPFNISIKEQTSGGNGYWVGEGRPKPLTRFDFGSNNLRWAKVANIAVISEELARFSSPSAETLVRDALAAALIERLDIDFIDPYKALVADVSPASITNGVTPIPSSGSSADAVRVDWAALMGTFIAAKMTPSSGVVIMSATTALALSLMRNELGQKEFPDITMTGGRFEGLPVIVSDYVGIPSSPSNNIIVLVNASDIYLADDGQVVIDVSREASLEMDDAPSNSMTAGSPPAPTGAQLVSLWQTNSIGLRAERFINWAKRRPTAVAYLDNVNYAASPSPA